MRIVIAESCSTFSINKPTGEGDDPTASTTHWSTTGEGDGSFSSVDNLASV